jgi:ABC-type transport system involved in cytochrome c biogenesis permease subunit
MSAQTTRTPHTPITSFLNESPDAKRLLPPKKPRSRGFWALLIVGTILNIAVIALGITLFVSSGKTIEPPAQRRISVPYADNADLWKALHGWVVQEDGRIKPLETFSRESVRTITGREKFEGNDAVAVVISWVLLNDPDENRAFRNAQKFNCDWDEYPFILCDHHELRALLYREKRGEDATLTEEELHGKYVEPKMLRFSNALKKVMRDIAAKQSEDGKAVLTPLEQKASEVKKRLALYERIRLGGQEGLERVHAPGEMGLVALDRHGPTWFSLRGIKEFVKTPALWDEVLGGRRIVSPRDYEKTRVQKYPADEAKRVADAAGLMQTAYLSGEVETFAASAEKFRAAIEDVSLRFRDYPGTDTTALELWFNTSNPFRKAWIFSLLTAILLLTSLAIRGRWEKGSRYIYFAGLVVYGVALFWSAAGFYCRVTISGRPPVSNMYESVIWVGFMTAVFGLLLELFHRKGVMALAGSLVSMFGLVLADQLPLTLAPNIQPLQAVLRSNYWLTIHVLTIVSSYAAFAVAWGLGNFNLGLMLFAPGRRDMVKALSQQCYRAIQIGVVLLAAGTLLGGFWAAESWGRFWGWDPKEVWALIALLCYVIPLHARFVGWVKDFGLAACSVICFSSVVMAWYGVNFVLGAGLHSYGFGGGNDAWVYWGGMINISLVVHAALRYNYWQPATAEESV